MNLQIGSIVIFLADDSGWGDYSFTGSQWPYHPNARAFDEYYGFTSGQEVFCLDF